MTTATNRRSYHRPKMSERRALEDFIISERAVLQKLDRHEATKYVLKAMPVFSPSNVKAALRVTGTTCLRKKRVNKTKPAFVKKDKGDVLAETIMASGKEAKIIFRLLELIAERVDITAACTAALYKDLGVAMPQELAEMTEEASGPVKV